MAIHEANARPMRRDAARNHELVLDAAREVISEFGTEASMELVASRAGVGVGTVYRRFPNKEALVDELVRIILDELITSARAALALNDGSGLEVFLRTIAQSLADHRGYASKLVSQTKASCSEILYQLIDELLSQANQHATIGPEVTLGDIRATIWALRGIIETTKSEAPGAWQRHLDIHLAGLRSASMPSKQPSLTVAQLKRISGVPKSA